MGRVQDSKLQGAGADPFNLAADGSSLRAVVQLAGLKSYFEILASAIFLCPPGDLRERPTNYTFDVDTRLGILHRNGSLN